MLRDLIALAAVAALTSLPACSASDETRADRHAQRLQAARNVLVAYLLDDPQTPPEGAVRTMLEAFPSTLPAPSADALLIARSIVLARPDLTPYEAELAGVVQAMLEADAGES